MAKSSNNNANKSYKYEASIDLQILRMKSSKQQEIDSRGMNARQRQLLSKMKMLRKCQLQWTGENKELLPQ
ncbi:senescence-associated gene 12 [Prunus dulcis]|uniref:Senescence-associated gene 12 n=1 Tax=Prunus dulcis TaxID=3755 RepID=A0A4Y1R5V8_PRUDU|nr:senescence-associated gene 12 [Prunus dulcis]